MVTSVGVNSTVIVMHYLKKSIAERAHKHDIWYSIRIFLAFIFFFCGRSVQTAAHDGWRGNEIMKCEIEALTVSVSIFT